METVLIAGGSGTIGRRLSELLLQRGYRVIVLSRKNSISELPGMYALQREYGRLQLAHWDIGQKTIAADAISGTDYIINLAGAGIAEKRWTSKRKEAIRNSRTESCALIIEGLRKYSNKVKAVISASATGWYGPDIAGNPIPAFTEGMPASHDFLGNTCKAWETSIAPVSLSGIRLVILRTGIVLGKTGGAFAEFRRPLHFRIATIFGSGRQMVSWIHEDDMCNIYLHALENIHMNGIYNAVAPHPVSNKALVTAIARQLYGKLYLPLKVPSFVLKIMLGEMAVEILKSTTVSCKKLTENGFIFRYPHLENAITGLLDKQ